MLGLVLAVLLSTSSTAISAPADTVVVLGEVERDLTGDGRPELLRVVGVGQSIDSLAVTFTIEAVGGRGEKLYELELSPMTRVIGFDAGRRLLTPAEHRTRLNEFGDWFFGDSKFETPARFLERQGTNVPGRVESIIETIVADMARLPVIDSLVAAGHRPGEARIMSFYMRGAPLDTAAAAAIWEEIRDSGVTIFNFSTGGDAISAIGWSGRERGVYRLLECC